MCRHPGLSELVSGTPRTGDRAATFDLSPGALKHVLRLAPGPQQLDPATLGEAVSRAEDLASEAPNGATPLGRSAAATGGGAARPAAAVAATAATGAAVPVGHSVASGEGQEKRGKQEKKDKKVCCLMC